MVEENIEEFVSASSEGLTFEWADGFLILVDRTDSEVIIKANAAGLVSLARHCLALARESVSPGSHIHMTDSVELEPGSGDLIIERLQE